MADRGAQNFAMSLNVGIEGRMADRVGRHEVRVDEGLWRRR
ncbi:hypothetical protein [Actinoallomurus sp. CA-142502]